MASTRPQLYCRPLPGGGFVVIDATARGGGEHHARLWVERRGDPTRRAGHQPPVIAELISTDLDGAMSALRAIAADNVALAQAMWRWSRRVT